MEQFLKRKKILALLLHLDSEFDALSEHYQWAIPEGGEVPSVDSLEDNLPWFFNYAHPAQIAELLLMERSGVITAIMDILPDLIVSEIREFLPPEILAISSQYWNHTEPVFGAVLFREFIKGLPVPQEESEFKYLLGLHPGEFLRKIWQAGEKDVFGGRDPLFAGIVLLGALMIEMDEMDRRCILAKVSPEVGQRLLRIIEENKEGIKCIAQRSKMIFQKISEER